MADALRRDGSSALPLRAVAAILGVIALLAGGWTLVNALLPNDASLSAGSTIDVGSKSGRAVTTLSGDGWQLERGQSNPTQEMRVRNGDVQLTMTYLQLPSTSEVADLWSGQRKLSALDGSTIGTPAAFTNAAGATGQAAPVTTDDATGSMALFVAPDQSYAVRMLSLGQPGATAQQRAAAQSAVGDLSFTGG